MTRLVNIEMRNRIEVNTDPQRRCYYGAHARSELRWTAWESVDWDVPEDKAEARLRFWKELNDYAVSQRGESARSEFRAVLQADGAAMPDTTLASKPPDEIRTPEIVQHTTPSQPDSLDGCSSLSHGAPPMFAKLSQIQATIINNARNGSSVEERKAIKREIFAAAKQRFGIPPTIKLKCETTNAASADYLVLKDKAGNRFDLGADGRWVHAPSDAGSATSTITEAPDQRKWFRVDPQAVVGAIRNLTDDLDSDDALDALPDTAAVALDTDDIAFDVSNNVIYVKVNPALLDD